jgi:hypothetical protein
MTIEELKQIIEPYIEGPIIEFVIEKQIFSTENGRKMFNKEIRKNVEKKFGVYFWLNTATNEIVYIGMAGKIKTDGTPGAHSVQNRLLASRGKNKATKKDIQTNDYVRNYMIDNNVEKLDFYIMYSKTGEPPAFIEALLLYKYYKKNNKLPKLNNSF